MGNKYLKITGERIDMLRFADPIAVLQIKRHTEYPKNNKLNNEK